MERPRLQARRQLDLDRPGAAGRRGHWRNFADAGALWARARPGDPTAARLGAALGRAQKTQRARRRPPYTPPHCPTSVPRPAQVGWKRTTELSRNPHLFLDSEEDESGDGGAEANDIIQGTLGDCYFLSSLAILCTSKGLGLVEKLFVCQDYFNQGLVGVRFFKEGMWWDIAVDTYVPCYTAYNPPYPCFGRCVCLGVRAVSA